jgi:uncharacterized protein with NAD-binding domain and iron-sulfur cluster
MGEGKKTVAVLGGGIAGLTAAHELSSRGYAVTVFEARGPVDGELGGKARSFRKPDGDVKLFGEHGFRFFPGFYQNVIDTMKRIDAAGGSGKVVDHLVPLETAGFYADREVHGGWKGRLLPSWVATSCIAVGAMLFLAWLITAGVLWWRAAPLWVWAVWLVSPALWVVLRTVVLAVSEKGDTFLPLRLPCEEPRRGYGPFQTGLLSAYRWFRWAAPLPIVLALASGDRWRLLPLAIVVSALIWWYPALATFHYLWRVLTKIPPGVRPGVFESLAATFRIGAVLTSSERRLYEQWERENWWSYIGAYRYSKAFRLAFATGLTRAFVATRAEQMSARTGATILGQLLYDISPTLHSRTGPADRVLDQPTHEAWINPWIAQLRDAGVLFNFFQHRDGSLETLKRVEVVRLLLGEPAVRDGRQVPTIGGFLFRDHLHARPRPAPQIFDHYVLAVSGTSAQHILANSPRVVRADREAEHRPDDELGLPTRGKTVPYLDGVFDLQFGWMTGIVYHLKERRELPKGHLLCLESDWALTAIEQTDTWKGVDTGPWSTIVSVNVSDWFRSSPRALPASREKLDRVAKETWRQLGQHVHELADVPWDTVHYLPDSALTDPSAGFRGPERSRDGENVPMAAFQNSTLTNDEKLLINTAGSWDHRPTAKSAFANLVLAGDYVRTWTDFASMEGANEAGRRAARTILRHDEHPAGSDSSPDRIETFALPVPDELSFLQDAVRRVDRVMMWASLPHPLLLLATPLGWFAGAEVALNRFVLRLRRDKRQQPVPDEPPQDATILPATASTADQSRDDARLTTSAASSTASP